MSLDAPSQGSPPVRSRDDLVAWLRAGEKPASQHRCGLETEKLGVFAESGRPVPLTGERSIARVLERMAAASGGQLLVEQGVPIGIQLANASVALEPGGQLELSGAPSPLLADSAKEVAAHLELSRRFGDELGIAWVACGYRPWGPRPEVPWLPRGRYGLMRAKLPGRLAHDMMQMTASVQANFDFSDEGDLASKVSVATAVSPLVAALFANSPLVDGRPSGFKSFRYRVWKEVDDRRSGLLRVMFEPGFTYERYVEWIVNVPLVFVRRQGRYVDPEGRTFADLMAQGLEGEPASMQDFVDQISTLFPEIRVKRVLEVRGADAVDARTTMALPALWTALLYDESSRREARALIDCRFEALVDFQEAVSREALEARLGSTPALDLARDLLALADDGLRRRHEAGLPDERPYLDPLREIVASGLTGADRTLALYARTNGDPAALVEAMRY
jgi:glutamate--cysteine ligase